MKIECTAEEKEWLLDAMRETSHCPKTFICKPISCRECYETQIKWTIDGGKCDCYHDEFGSPQCWGTKEREYCICRGYKSKCDFYKEVREGD